MALKELQKEKKEREKIQAHNNNGTKQPEERNLENHRIENIYCRIHEMQWSTKTKHSITELYRPI